MNDLFDFGYSRHQCDDFYEKYCSDGLGEKIIDLSLDFWANDKDNAMFMIYKLSTALLSALTLINLRYSLYAQAGIDYQSNYDVYNQSSKRKLLDEKLNIHFVCGALA